MRQANCCEAIIRANRPITRSVFKLAAVAILALASANASADQIVHRFDFGNFGGPVEPGWTNQHYFQLFDNTAKIAGKRTHAGNLVGETVGTPTFTPIGVMRDWFSTYNLGGDPDYFDGPTPFMFRDYVPDYTSFVAITIYRSSENDPYTNTGDVQWSTTGADDPINNTWSLLDGGDGLTSDFHAPITGTFFIAGSSRIDFNFKGYVDTMRINGIQLVYTVPEPSSLGLLALGVPALLRRRVCAA